MMTRGAGLLFLASLFHMFLCSYLLTSTPLDLATYAMVTIPVPLFSFSSGKHETALILLNFT